MSSTTLLGLTPGRALLTLASLSCSVSCYIADYNETHVFNPNWPPHARFHNGQTMSMGLTLGLLSLYLTWRPQLSPSLYGSKVAGSDSVFLAALVGSLYWITGLSASLYPGTEWIDPEFRGGSTDVKFFGYAAQLTVFSVHLLVVWAGYALEMGRLRGVKVD